MRDAVHFIHHRFNSFQLSLLLQLLFPLFQLFLFFRGILGETLCCESISTIELMFEHLRECFEAL